MELHLVHKKTSYSSVTASLSYNDGLAVIGIMFQLADTSDAGLTVSLTTTECTTGYLGWIFTISFEIHMK